MSGSRITVIWNRLGRMGLCAQAVVVSGVVAVVWLAMAPAAYGISGSMGLIAAATGAGLCWAGAELALAMASFFRESSAAAYGMVIGMLARAFLPLLFGALLHLRVPALAEAGMVYYLLISYMATLATETALMLAHVQRNPNSSKAT
jgi:hypothetical protein